VYKHEPSPPKTFAMFVQQLIMLNISRNISD